MMTMDILIRDATPEHLQQAVAWLYDSDVDSSDVTTRGETSRTGVKTVVSDLHVEDISANDLLTLTRILSDGVA